ncbi:MAG: caspase family protein [Bacteroidetes bacterium]|nr:caspase family protein [Bacteroidota bacterium]
MRYPHFVKCIWIVILAFSGTFGMYGSIKPTGSIIVSKSKFGNSKVFYLGISTSKAILENGFQAGPFNSDSDLFHFNFLLKNQFKVSDTNIFPLYGISEIKKIQNAISEINSHMRNEDIFIFHFAGVSTLFNDELQGKKPETRFYLQREHYSTKPSEFFTMNILKFWLDQIPARNQIILIDGGITANLKTEIVQSLTEKNLSRYLLEERKRVIISNYGMGMEIKSGGVLSTSFIQILDEYKTPYTAFNDIFSDKKNGLYFQNKLQHRIDSYSNSELNMIREWEIISVLHNFKIDFQQDTVKMRSDNIQIKPIVIAENKIQHPPRSYALVVGMNHYQFMTELSNPILDGMSMNYLLEKKFKYTAKFIPDCTSEEFWDALIYFKDSVQFGEHDQLLLYVAGHGTYVDYMKTGAIAFTNTKPIAGNPGMEKYVTYTNLFNLLSYIPCKNVMVIMDVCFGGTATKSADIQQDVNACGTSQPSGFQIKGLSDKDNKQVLWNLNCANRCYLTSGGNEYVPDGTPGAHSPFSSALLDYLESCGTVTMTSDLTNNVRNFIRNEKPGVPVPSSGKFGVNSTQTDFVWYAPQ